MENNLEKLLAKIEENKKLILLITTAFFVFIFFFILYKSYKISKIKKDITVLPLIKNEKKNEPVKIKHVIEDVNLGDVGSYQVLNKGDVNEKIKVINNSNDEYDLNKKINEIVKEEEKNKTETTEEVVISDNIQEININKNKQIGLPTKQINENHFKAQLVALTNRQQAESFLNKTKNEHQNLLKTVEIYISEIDLKGKGVFYRVHVGPFRTKLEVDNFCEAYLKNSNKGLLNCIAVK